LAWTQQLLTDPKIPKAVWIRLIASAHLLAETDTEAMYAHSIASVFHPSWLFIDFIQACDLGNRRAYRLYYTDNEIADATLQAAVQLIDKFGKPERSANSIEKPSSAPSESE
jgi:hypothetical protein